MEEDCFKEITCANCRQDHPAYARSCAVYKDIKKKLRLNTRGMCPSWKQGELSGAIWEKTAMPLLHRGQIIEPMKTNVQHS